MTKPRDLAPLPKTIVDTAIEMALAEDLGASGDITTNATVSADAWATGFFVARQPGVLSGNAVAQAVFHAVDARVVFDAIKNDGDVLAAADRFARVEGPARALLTAERVALNFLGRLSGIATLTRRFVDAVEGTGAVIADTRKTTPGLRAFEKYAVRCGGGHNHRTGLFDAIMIKDNHIVAAGGVGPAIERARAAAGHMVKIEVEVDTLDQLREVLTYRVDVVLLDNMSPEMLREAVHLVKDRCLTEASGGVSLQTVRKIAETGVDLISVGALTHSAPVLDIGLDFAPRSGV